MTVNIASPSPGDKVVLVPDVYGRQIAIAVQSPVAGDKVVIIYDRQGKAIAVPVAGGGIPPVPTPTVGRFGHCAVELTNGDIIFFGGCIGREGYGSIAYPDDVWRGRAGGLVWECICEHAGWQGRVDACAIALSDDTILMFGGRTSLFPDINSRLNDVWSSPDRGLTWTHIADVMESPYVDGARWGARMVLTTDENNKERILLGGGMEWNGGGWWPSRSIWKSDNKGISWEFYTYFPDPAHHDPAEENWWPRAWFGWVTMPDGSLVLFGGYVNQGGGAVYPYRSQAPAHDVWISTDKGMSYTKITYHAGWNARVAFGFDVSDAGEIILYGGCPSASSITGILTYDTGLTDFWYSDNAGAAWTQIGYHDNCEDMTLTVTKYNKLIRIGGMRALGGQVYSFHAWQSDVSWGNWRQVLKDLGIW